FSIKIGEKQVTLFLSAMILKPLGYCRKLHTYLTTTRSLNDAVRFPSLWPKLPVKGCWPMAASPTSGTTALSTQNAIGGYRQKLWSGSVIWSSYIHNRVLRKSRNAFGSI